MTRKKSSKRNYIEACRKRAKKEYKKRYGVSLSYSKINEVWKDYCEFGLIRPLLKYGSAEMGSDFVLEIVGKKLSGAVADRFSKGLIAKRGVGLVEHKRGDGRKGVVYKIKLTDSNYKEGKVIFEAHPKLRKRLTERLIETTAYYKIES